MDIRIELVSVLTDRELLIIVNWDIYFLSANWFLVWVVELGDVWMLQGLLSSESLVWVKVKEVLH